MSLMKLTKQPGTNNGRKTSVLLLRCYCMSITIRLIISSELESADL